MKLSAEYKIIRVGLSYNVANWPKAVVTLRHDMIISNDIGKFPYEIELEVSCAAIENMQIHQPVSVIVEFNE